MLDQPQYRCVTGDHHAPAIHQFVGVRGERLLGRARPADVVDRLGKHVHQTGSTVRSGDGN